MAAKVSKNGKNGKNGKAAKAAHGKLPATVWPMRKLRADRFRVGYEDLAIQGKDALSTLVAVNAAMTDVFERLSLEFAGLARATFESAAAAGAALVDARSLEDVTAIQNEFARTCIARLLAQGTRFSELGLKAATEVYEPLSARAGKAMSVLGRPYAS
jgi:phasin family protein